LLEVLRLIREKPSTRLDTGLSAARFRASEDCELHHQVLGAHTAPQVRVVRRYRVLLSFPGPDNERVGRLHGHV